VTTDAPATATPSPEPVQFTWKGQVLSKSQVGNIFFFGSLLLLGIGVSLNWVLTEGRWWVPSAGPQQYVQFHPYDLTSSVVLGLSLVLLGAGFIGTTAERRSLRKALMVSAWLACLCAIGGGLAWLDVVPTLTNLRVAMTSVAVAVVAITAMIAIAYRWNAQPAHVVRAFGFVLFGFYWATQAMKLYASENGDFVNAIFAMFAVFFFNYFAYHELVSYKRNEDPRALQWLAGTAFITTGVYFLTHKIEPVATWLILTVAEQTTWLLHAFGQPVVRCGGSPDGSMIYYPSSELGCLGGGWFPIQIILACTAIQSIMIFVGGIFALKPPRMGDGVSGKPTRFEKLAGTYGRRRLWGLLLTIPLIYVLNLFRNVIIIWMSGQQTPILFASHDTAFWFSHNVIGKGGSLVALVVIAFIVFQILPELYDSIIGLLDLKQRKGPLEQWLGDKFGRRPGGRLKETAPAPSAPVKAPPPAEPQLE
ncbi:MAG TPA: archaeosortase A, partial [Candidatus Thermoplasmatota archaeon]